MIEKRKLSTVGDEATAVNGSGEITINSPLPARLHELEKRISAALADDSARAASLSHLLQQVDWALPEAEQYAAVERDRSLDPTQSPDPREARQAAEDATFLANRLKSFRHVLLQRHERVSAHEQVQAYEAKRDVLRVERDALERELEVYSRAAGEIVDLFQRLGQFRQRAHQELGYPPANVDPLPDLAVKALLDKTQLFTLDGRTQLWPPPSSFAADYVSTMTVQHPGAMWSDPAVQERRRAELAAENDRLALHAQRAAKEQEQRLNAEERARFAARQQQGGQL